MSLDATLVLELDGVAYRMKIAVTERTDTFKPNYSARLLCSVDDCGRISSANAQRTRNASLDVVRNNYKQHVERRHPHAVKDITFIGR